MSEPAKSEPEGAKPAREPIRFGISLVLLTVLLTLIAGISAIVIWQSYRKSIEEAMSAGRQLFANLNTDVALQQNALLAPVRVTISSLAQVPTMGRINAASVARSFKPILEAYPHLATIRIGFADGSLTEVAGDAGAGQGGSMSGEPREAPWYKAAMAAPGRTVETLPYVLASGRPGISVARTIDGAEGVIAADIELKQFSLPLESLATEPDEQMFLFTSDQRLFAHADFNLVVDTAGAPGDVKLRPVDSLTHPAARALIAAFRAEGAPFGTRRIVADGRAYMATVTRLGPAPEANPEAAVFFAFAMPESTFTGVFISIGRDAVLISGVIMLLSIPVIVLVARRLARPLAALSAATERIAQLDLTAAVSKPTRIREIARLGDSLDRMKAALGQMAKYVPKSLVQDLISSGMAADVGGDRRELSFMFTDVRDFTPMAETLPAEELMAQMSQYFDGLVSAILECHGTVDKYVGDAIFAYWNAPLRQEDHAGLACLAALACRATSNRLNTEWQREGRRQWYTRIGVHLGEAVVGNVGSRDRVDYTAIGNAVNIASRLEGLNKLYGTQIVISGQVAERVAGRFVVRPIDVVSPKGAVAPLRVYELLGTVADGPLAATVETRARCRDWGPVMAAYERRDWGATAAALDGVDAVHKGDEVSAALRERVNGFIADPPPATWDGVTRLDSK